MSLFAVTTRLTFGKMDLSRVARLTWRISLAGTCAIAALTLAPTYSWLPSVGLLAWIVSCTALYLSMRAEAALIVESLGRVDGVDTTARIGRPVKFREASRSFPLTLSVTSRFPLAACAAKTGQL